MFVSTPEHLYDQMHSELRTCDLLTSVSSENGQFILKSVELRNVVIPPGNVVALGVGSAVAERAVISGLHVHGEVALVDRKLQPGLPQEIDGNKVSHVEMGLFQYLANEVKPASVSLLLMIGVEYAYLNLESRKELLRLMQRALKPGGLCIIFPMSSEAYYEAGKELFSDAAEKYEDIRLLSPKPDPVEVKVD